MGKLRYLFWLTIITSALVILFHATGLDLGVFIAFIAWFFIALILVMLSCDE